MIFVWQIIGIIVFESCLWFVQDDSFRTWLKCFGHWFRAALETKFHVYRHEKKYLSRIYSYRRASPRLRARDGTRGYGDGSVVSVIGPADNAGSTGACALLLACMTVAASAAVHRISGWGMTLRHIQQLITSVVLASVGIRLVCVFYPPRTRARILYLALIQ